MKKKAVTRKIIYVVAVILFIIYAVTVLVNQQIKLNSYATQKANYEEQLKDLNEKHDELVEMKENVNSPEYIEQIAREKLDMYYPNERVYVDISK